MDGAITLRAAGPGDPAAALAVWEAALAARTGQPPAAASSGRGRTQTLDGELIVHLGHRPGRDGPRPRAHVRGMGPGVAGRAEC